MSKSILAASLFPALAFSASCSSAQTGDSAPSSTVSTTGAPASQTIVAGEPVSLDSQTPFTAASHGTFAEPWAIAVHPQNGTLFVTEKAGTMKVYDPSSGRQGSVTGLPEVAYGGQGGLGDFVFAPDFAQSGAVYLSWAASAGGDARKAVVGRGRLACDQADACRIEGLAPVWEQSLPIASAGHFSHKIAFSPDGRYLFVSSGDRMQGAPAQDLSNNLGSVVRLMPDGTPAPGNPFADRGGATSQVWTYGQRNILGLAFDPEGELWGLEHGPRGGDELNHLEPGNNYGWPVRSNGNDYSGTDIPDHTADDGFVKPAISWNPVIAPGGMIQYQGSRFSDWTGDFILAGLVQKGIVRVRVSGNTAIEAARISLGARIRQIDEGPDGSIWALQDGTSAKLIELSPG